MRRGKVVVLFAGLGGACTGMAEALGHSPDVAINHDEIALRVHARNHPSTVHLVEDVWRSPPRVVTGGRHVTDLWLSPDCTHFSAAKGDVPKEKNIRSLAWVGVRWAREVRPTRIYLENVREFEGWGPLYEPGNVLQQDFARGTGKKRRVLYPAGTLVTPEHPLCGIPIPERKGETFEQFVGQLRLLGYAVEWRVLDSSRYGARTRRRRLFLVARCDGLPICWPEPTHGDGPDLLPLRTAAECIDWSLPCPSIFLSTEEGKALGVKRPLAEKTLWRVAEGMRRFVFENPRPFIVKLRGQCHSADVAEPLPTITANGTHLGVVVPTLIQTGYGERPGQRPRALDLHQPLGTIMATGQKHALVAAFLAKHYGGHSTPGSSLAQPMDTITATDHHSLVTATLAGDGLVDRSEQVNAFLMSYYSNGTQWASLNRPMPTITTLHRLGIVTVQGENGPEGYRVIDVGMRMLRSHELMAAQFGEAGEEYDLSDAPTERDKIRLIGNSVVPDVAEALVRANVGGTSKERRAA